MAAPGSMSRLRSSIPNLNPWLATQSLADPAMASIRASYSGSEPDSSPTETATTPDSRAPTPKNATETTTIASDTGTPRRWSREMGGEAMMAKKTASRSGMATGAVACSPAPTSTRAATTSNPVKPRDVFAVSATELRILHLA
jgi:hypothetical protein